MKTFKEIRERVGQMRPWKKGWDPKEEDQLRKDKKLKKDLETYKKKKKQIKSIKDAEKYIPYLLNHINTNFGNGKGGDLSDEKFHQLSNAVMFYYDYEYLYDSVNQIREATGREITLDWDMGNPEEYAPDWQDQGVYLDNWNKRKMEIEISGTEKHLLAWLVDDYGMDKKEAQQEIRKGKRIKI